jgi:hypothetical protein
MANNHPCPECGKSDWKQEAGEYALLATEGGRLELHTEAARTQAVVVRASICTTCRFVKLFEA